MAIAANLKDWLEDCAKRLGFDLCGVAPASLDAENRDHYLQWLEQGFHGEMGYMKRFERQDLHSLMPGVRSVICLGMNYQTDHGLSIDCPDSTRGWIARYAWGDDYHEMMRERMEQLVEQLRAELGAEKAGAEMSAAINVGLEAKIYVDTGPLLERAVASAAGLGWIAKNTCLINEQVGSWFFLGAILTNLDLEPGLPAPDRCGTCTKCLDACPTGAITEPYVLDATRCISYYTIEVKGAIPELMRPQLGRHIFGCDICQDVCPWNRAAPISSLPAFQPRPLADQSRARQQAGASQQTGLPDPPLADARGSDWTAEDCPTAFNPPLEFLAELSEEQFQEAFRGSPIRRPKYRGFLRNVAVAMGNSRDPKFRPILERLSNHTDLLIREHAHWALNQLSRSE